MADGEPLFLQADRRAALLVWCPNCETDPGDECWSDDGRSEVDIHEERVAAVVELTDGDSAVAFDRYDQQGKLKDPG